MVHLPPLPGAPGFSASVGSVLHRATADARALLEGGIDAVLVENYGDAPFHAERVEPVTVAAMTLVVARVCEEVAGAVPVGVNVLRNDAASALAIAAATGAEFIRVNVHTGGMYTDQGWIEGKAAETLRLRRVLAPAVAILADVMVKHAVAPEGFDLSDVARDAWHRGLADALIVSGRATGEATGLERVAAVRAAVPEATVLVGSGVTTATVAATLDTAHGAIVGSALEADGIAGRPVEIERVRRMMEAARTPQSSADG